MSRRPSPWTMALLAVGCSASLLATGCPGDDTPSLPIESALKGADGRQRFVLTLDLPPPDLVEFRRLQKDDPGAVAAYVEKQRTALGAALGPVESQLAALGGRVIERWWMTNQATIEMQGSSAATIQGVAGVKKLEIDQPPQ